jgi:hypothetical protein
LESGESKFHEIVGRAISDPEFRQMLMDPEQQAEALSQYGIERTPAVTEALANADEALGQLSEVFGPSRVAS